MTLERDRVRKQLRDFDLQTLFIDELGWDHGGTNTEVVVEDDIYGLEAIAQKRGMVVYQYAAESDEEFPDRPTRRKIEKTIAKTVHEHLIVYTPRDRSVSYWEWVKREPGRSPRTRQHIHYPEQSGEGLYQKLEKLRFALEEEDDLTIVDVTGRVRAAFDVEKVTKKFYERFKKEHHAFLEFIGGIESKADREWYASLMLNRLMFIYFIQKRGFLNSDTNYLNNRLRRMQYRFGRDRFQSFYRLFMLRLFHEGLGQPEAKRRPELETLLGRVPYLNGGLFDVHDIERDNPDVHIPDEAFERIFAFFEKYQWHLDSRPLRNDNEINPDVLGYIFEKYVNQKQMGAYYTKEDITGYISRNTVIPFLFDQASEACPIAFTPSGGVWSLLPDEPDRYIHEEFRHGITYDIHKNMNLTADRKLPADIAAGLMDVAKRCDWNKLAPSEYGLSTETWREHIARRRRYEEVRAKLSKGEIRSINDLVTYNLDIEKFIHDVIAWSEGPELVRAFWMGLNKLTILDPTCGSGAFLFTALNILEPVYTTCLESMRGFLDDLKRRKHEQGPERMNDFSRILAQVGEHASERYFILKSIIVHNLFGVDIMEEAVEICKLRLFLKLVAQLESYDQIEPLPDIDFNIRSGNTLIGFTTLKEIQNAFVIRPDGQRRILYAEDEAKLKRFEKEAEIADKAFHNFRELQTDCRVSANTLTGTKVGLRKRLDGLRAELDGHLANEHRIEVSDYGSYKRWRDSHRPFHWFVEYYSVMRQGGFDVIIGNPPYRELRAVKEYTIHNLSFITTRNLYALVMERCLQLSQRNGRLGFIVPVSSISTNGYKNLQDIILKFSGHFSSYDDRPSRLFDGLQHIRLTIHLLIHRPTSRPIYNVTEFQRWSATERQYLFRLLKYQGCDRDYLVGCLPKISGAHESSIMRKIWSDRAPLGERQGIGGHLIYYSRKISHFLQVLDFVPEIYDKEGVLRMPSELKELRFSSESYAAFALCVLNSSLFRWFVSVFSDCRNLNRREVLGFPINFTRALDGTDRMWTKLAAKLARRLRETSEFREMRFKNDSLRVQCIIPKFSKSIIDEIDHALGKHYSFSEDETDFIINFNIKYRVGIGE